jgi:hypothetical protein
MPPVLWASLEQKEKVYLLAHCDTFIEAQKNKLVYKFWINIHQEWFLTFPQKIKGWFNNHGSKARKSKPIVVQVNAKSRRRLPTTELYSRKFYDMKIKPKVDAEMEALSLPKKQ